VAPGLNADASGTTVNFNGFTNQGLGSVTIGANTKVNVANFQSYGTVTLNPAPYDPNNFEDTRIINVGTSGLSFDSGSRTYIGTPSTANVNGSPTFDAGIDLGGYDSVVTGGLFVNNGYVVDSSNNGMGTAAVISDYGALVKGAGIFQNSVVTRNGGRFLVGNSPGSGRVGNLIVGSGGVSNYIFEIDDATGMAGPTPDGLGHVDGWGLIQAGSFLWTADAANKLTMSLQTLINPTTVGSDPSGLMDNFDPTQSYSWAAVKWTGAYTGPTDVAALNASTVFDTSAFQNSFNGTFAWNLDVDSKTLYLTYTPA
jgi:hypothetical protein